MISCLNEYLYVIVNGKLQQTDTKDDNVTLIVFCYLVNQYIFVGINL
jgi:hypothetical protein